MDYEIEFKNYIDALLQEYQYARNPKLAAEVVKEKIGNSKVLLYGDGLHSKEFTSYFDSLLAVVRDVSKDPGFLREEFSIPVIDISLIDDYDYLVLLGYWGSEKVKSFCRQYSIDEGKIFLPYMQNEMIVEADKKFQIEPVKSTKPILCVLLYDDRRDFFTIASKAISKYFDLVKIYVNGSFTYYENEHYAQVLSANGNLRGLKAIISSLNPDVIVYFHASPIENILEYEVFKTFGDKAKLIHATTDFTFNEHFDLTYEEFATWFGKDTDFIKFVEYFERKVALEADGVISNCAGEYATDSYLKDAKSFYFCKYLQEKETFTFANKDTDDELRVCYAGNVAFDNNRVMHKITTLNSVFEEIVSQGIYVHLFNFGQNKYAPPYDNLKKSNFFVWENFVSGVELPELISGFDFGLNLLNVTEEYKQICKVHFNSHFHAKTMTYIASGLPIIVNDEFTILKEFVYDNKIGFSVKRNEICNIGHMISKVDYSSLKENVRNYQNSYLAKEFDCELADYLLSVYEN